MAQNSIREAPSAVLMPTAGHALPFKPGTPTGRLLQETFRIVVAHERPKEQNPVGTPASVRLVFSRIILADGSSVNPQTGVEELRP